MRNELTFGGLQNDGDETKVPMDKAWAMQNCTTINGVLEGGPRYDLFGERTSASDSDVGYGFGYGKYSSNESQKLALSYSSAPTSGQIELVFDGQTTNSNIPFNATATQVLTALESLSNINVGDVKVTGGPWPAGPIFVEFTGQYANTDVALMTSTDNTLNNSATLTPAEFIKGGETEVYLAAVKKSGDSTVTIYKVSTAGVFTSIATGLTASDWFFEQYGDKVYAVNATDGLNYYRIGGAWNDGAGTTKPHAPAVPPTFTYTLVGGFIDFSSGFAGITQSGLGGSPTVTGTATGISITNGATPLTAQTQITITAEYSSANDWQFNDLWFVVADSAVISDVSIIGGSVKIQLVNNDGSPVTHNPFVDYNTGGGINAVQYAHFANQARTTRDNILKIVIKFTVAHWAASKQVTLQVYKGLSYMCSNVPFPFQFNSSPTPTQSKIRYAFAYYNTTTGVESDLSEEAQTQTIPSTSVGVNVILTLRGSSELTTSDRIYVYRQQNSGEWRRLPTDANNLTTYGAANVTSGTTTFTDKWMEEELKDFPVRSGPVFQNSRATLAGLSLWTWKQSLVIGAARRVWQSFVGIPNRFAPDPDDKDAVIEFVTQNADNADIGQTVYLSDNRAEDVYGGVGQDTNYAIGPLSTYAIVGDSPGSASPPRRLPGSRGTISKRGFYRFRGGVHVASEDGLWYYAVGRGFSGEDNGALVDREETDKVRRSYQTTLLGSSYSGLVGVEHNDEVWLFNGAKYLVNNRGRRWEEGTFTDSVLACVSVRSRGLKFMSSAGRIYSISSSYTDDDGDTVTWSYETGILEGPASRITGIEIQQVGTPRVSVRVWSPFGTDGEDDYGKFEEFHFDTTDESPTNITPLVIESGHRHKITVTGQVGRDKVTSLALESEGTGKAYGSRR